MSDVLQGHTRDEVWSSFRNLKELHESECMAPCASYIPIRLVTIIEQFCRVTFKRRKLTYEKEWSASPIAVPILVDVLCRFDPDIKRGECENRIREYRRRVNKSTDGGIRLKSDNEVCRLVESVLEEQNAEAAEWIRLYTLSFQNLRSIKDKLDVGITREMGERCDELFGMRHAAAHTLSDRRVGNAAFATAKALLKLINTGEYQKAAE